MQCFPNSSQAGCQPELILKYLWNVMERYDDVLKPFAYYK